MQGHGTPAGCFLGSVAAQKWAAFVLGNFSLHSDNIYAIL
ncbi:hypothetical protein HMPREF1153_1976 [Selenomonas sp. CM52]|nr:hypothetical protein HMPREF1153_1976 [Selenomonas sp. CM52]